MGALPFSLRTSPLLFPFLPSPPLPYPFPPLPSPPLEVGPKYSYGVWGSAVSSPSGVWGEAPADKRFVACLSKKGQI